MYVFFPYHFQNMSTWHHPACQTAQCTHFACTALLRPKEQNKNKELRNEVSVALQLGTELSSEHRGGIQHTFIGSKTLKVDSALEVRYMLTHVGWLGRVGWPSPSAFLLRHEC